MVSGPALIRALRRLDDVRGLGIALPPAAHIPPSRIAALARFSNTAKVTAINRLPASRRLATLVAFAVSLKPVRTTMRWKFWRRYYVIFSTMRRRLTRKPGCVA